MEGSSISDYEESAAIEASLQSGVSWCLYCTSSTFLLWLAMRIADGNCGKRRRLGLNAQLSALKSQLFLFPTGPTLLDPGLNLDLTRPQGLTAWAEHYTIAPYKIILYPNYPHKFFLVPIFIVRGETIRNSFCASMLE